MTEKIQIDQIRSAMMNDLNAFVIAANVELQSRIIDKMPVKTGALRGSLNAGLNERVESFGRKDPTGTITKALNEREIARYKTGDDIFMVIGAPYAVYLEEGTPHIMPIGFVKRTMNELPAIFNKAKRTMQKYRKKTK